MATEDRRKAMFIDDVSKTVIFTDNHEEKIHMEGAYWVPALGYTRNSDNFDGHIYVSGATGAGKSYVIMKTILNDKLKRQVILFTDLNKEDPVLKAVHYKKFDVEGEYNWDWINHNQQNKIMIFDDVQFNTEILAYRDAMLEKGRHMNTIVVCVNHRLQDYQKTLVPLNEARYVIMFPNTNKANVKRYLDSELGMDKKELNKLINFVGSEGRHMILHKFHPVCVASAQSIVRI